jgi:hypothetical protein
MDAPAQSASPYAPPRAAIADIESDESNIRIEYDLKYRDNLLYNCLHLFTSAPVQVYMLLMVLTVPFAWRNQGAAFIVFAMVVVYLFLWTLQIAFTAIVLASKNRSLLTHYKVVIQNEGFSVETPYARNLYFWNGGVTKVASRPGQVAVYINTHAAHVIPARAFANADHRGGFVSTLRKRMAAGRPSR